MDAKLEHFKNFVKINKLHISCVTLLIFLALPSVFQVLFTVVFIVFGLASTCYFMREMENIGNMIPYLQREKKVRLKGSDEFCKLKRKCPACMEENCERHRPEINFVALQPWSNLRIPKKADAALEELLNLVLKDHVYTWYREISEDEALVDEIRSSLRFVSAIALRRISKIDIPQFVQTKVLRVLIRHLHFYLEVKKKASPGTDLEQAVLEHYGRHLHVAARNRKAEVDYIGHMINLLLPHVVHKDALQCRSLCILLREILSMSVILPAMDLLANPDIVNHILVLLFDDSPPVTCTDPPSTPVSLLGNFNKPKSKIASKLNLSLVEILKDPERLFPFMQFMKSEGAVSVLQFYLTVEEFNNRILNPELNEKELTMLHEELQRLHRMYMAPSAAVDTIKFDDDVISQIRTICDGPAEEILKLQTSLPLFKAQEQAYELLENAFLPLFHQSDHYFGFICGERINNSLQRSGSRLNKKVNGSITSKIGSKIKGVFKPSTIEGGKIDNCIDYTEAAEEKMEEELAEVEMSYRNLRYKLWEDTPLRDLSAWRVTIPAVANLPDPDNPKRTALSFCVDVRRVDIVEEDFESSLNANWIVQRQYGEFYVLEQKLKEFHGESIFEEIELPPKRVFGTKSQEYLESKRAAFQTYLQRLLTLPILKGSELLYKFLTSDSEMSSSFLPDINISRLVKTGALKLVKERGQHLEPFIESYLKSTENPKPIPCRGSDKDSDTQSISSEKMSNPVFDNNADKALMLTGQTPLHLNLNSIDFIQIDGATDMIMYLLDNVYKCPAWLHHVMMSLRFVFRGTLDSLLDWFLAKKIDKFTQDYRLEKLIHEIRDVLFFDEDPPRTDEQKQTRKDHAFQCLQDLFPKVSVFAMGTDVHREGTQLMFDVLQKPKLNKQLSYMLLDEALREIFPELIAGTDSRHLLNDLQEH